jgi:Zn ribbon nucleic-acid-binding protein
MSRKCPECKKKTLEITGMGSFGDTILVECTECGYEAELEPDGLGEGGFEMIEAMQIEYGREESDGG